MLLRTVPAGRRDASVIRDDDLRANPCAGVTRPPVPTRKVTVYSPKEVDEALGKLDPWWYPMVAQVTKRATGTDTRFLPQSPAGEVSAPSP